jgi:3-oxoacyl-[acyl-carrier protein] reductase
MTLNFESKTVLITGGSRGIGEACVKLFAEAGAKVIFTYNSNGKNAEELVKRFSSVTKIKSYKVDFSDTDSLGKKINIIISDFKNIDILVNNAGVWEYGKIDEMKPEEWNKTIAINLTGTFLFTKAVIPLMKKNKFGRIINITSTAGQRGEPFYSHYAASKGGVISFTKSLAAELGEFGITVNSVAPGWVITDMTKDVFADKKYKEKIRNEIPVKRIAEAEDIGGPVLFLASDLAKQINGEILNVNGGSVLCG